jgi:hypothetical protein
MTGMFWRNVVAWHPFVIRFDVEAFGEKVFATGEAVASAYVREAYSSI